MNWKWLLKLPELKRYCSKIPWRKIGRASYSTAKVTDFATTLGNLKATKDNTAATIANTKAMVAEAERMAAAVTPPAAPPPPTPPPPVASSAAASTASKIAQMAAKGAVVAGNVYAGYQLHSLIVDEEKTIPTKIATGTLIAGQAYLGLAVIGGPATIFCLVGGFGIGFLVGKLQQS